MPQGKKPSLPITAIEFFFFSLIMVGHSIGVLPISSTPYLLTLVWISLQYRDISWANIGVSIPSNIGKWVTIGIIAGGILQCWGYFVQEPFFDWLTGQTQDHSQFEQLEGNLGFFIIMLTLNWLLAAFGEEAVYRGYLLTRLIDLFGTGLSGQTLALAIGGIIFGLAHLWQGVSGVLDAATMGILYGLLFIFSGRNVLVPAVAHGINNTIGLFLLYLGFGLQ